MSNNKSMKPFQTSLQCLCLKKHEKLLIITDQNKLSIAKGLFDVAIEFGASVQLILIPETQSHGTEPPEPLPEYMLKFDTVIAPTTKSITHTNARRNASKAGVRIATMPDITEETFYRTMEADYHKIAIKGELLAKFLKNASQVKVTSQSGTNITFSIKDRIIKVDTGLLNSPGDYCNLPAGEVFLAPEEETGNGVIIVDGSMAGIGLLDEPLIISINNGYAVNIEGENAGALKSLLEPHGKKAYNLAEFGIGINDKAVLSGSPLEDEKVIGTVHFALGDNRSMGGKVEVSSHLDGIVKKPSVWVDGKIIMEDGNLIK